MKIEIKKAEKEFIPFEPINVIITFYDRSELYLMMEELFDFNDNSMWTAVRGRLKEEFNRQNKKI